MMPRERLLQHRLQQRWHLRRKGLGADRRRDIALLGQLPQQVGQAGGELTPRCRTASCRGAAGFKSQLIALEALAHLNHVILQRGAADEPLIRQVFQLIENAEVRKRTSRNVMRSWAVRGTCCAFGAVSSSAWKLVGLSIFS